LADLSYQLLNRIESGRFSKAISTEIDEFKEQIEDLKEISENFKSSLGLFQDKAIQSLLNQIAILDFYCQS